LTSLPAPCESGNKDGKPPGRRSFQDSAARRQAKKNIPLRKGGQGGHALPTGIVSLLSALIQVHDSLAEQALSKREQKAPARYKQIQPDFTDQETIWKQELARIRNSPRENGGPRWTAGKKRCLS
jgi:hypothetical protein